MLLSGNDNHIAGMGRQGLYTGEFGYEGRLTSRIVPVPGTIIMTRVFLKNTRYLRIPKTETLPIGRKVIIQLIFTLTNSLHILISIRMGNLTNDIAELNDLKESEPEKLKELMAEWIKYTKETKAQFPTPSGE